MTAQKCTLLVVDDEPYILPTLKALLSPDFEVLTADSADTAEALFGRHRIELILTDQKMPRRTGVQLLEWVRQHHPQTQAGRSTAVAHALADIDGLHPADRRAHGAQLGEVRPHARILVAFDWPQQHHRAIRQRQHLRQVRRDERWESLTPHLEEIGVGLVVVEELDQLNGVFEEMSTHVGGKPEPGLRDMPGVTPEQTGGCYEAAALFFRQSPWKKVGYESAIMVECDRFQSGPWYAVLMGQSGLTTGLALNRGSFQAPPPLARYRRSTTPKRMPITIRNLIGFEGAWGAPVCCPATGS